MSDTGAFRGWRIVTVAFASQAVAIGFSVGTFGIFVEPLTAEFDSTRAQVSLGQSILMATMTLAGLIVGPQLDRRSIRSIMVAGALLQAVCLALASQATSLWELAILFGVGVGLAVAMVGPLASTTVVSKWFDEKRGRAQGFTNMGGPAGGAVASVATGLLIANLGWRPTLLVFAAVTLLVIPLIWTVIRNRPEDIGQWPDGAEAPPAGSEGVGAGVESRAWTASALLRARSFWLLALAVGLLFGIATGWVVHIVPLCVDLGLGVDGGGAILGVGALLGIAGTLAFGAMADRYDQRWLLAAILAVHIVGFLILWAAAGPWVLAFVVCVIGFAGGGMMPVYATLIGRMFGPASFGQVMGLVGFVMLPFAFSAPPVAGWLRDRSDNYEAAFLMFSSGLILSLLLLGALRLPDEEASKS
ncbi:MFS transporter [Myxococcota bacterium]|nr:MFS transporter [Myxococcota bacterium]